MSSGTRICGVVQARDEWPLLGLSIAHALLHHVHEVFVLDHSSTDDTPEGLRRLALSWPGRVHVFRYRDDSFWQEACLSTLLGICAASSPDWIYVFDADEFLLTREPAAGLREVLDSVPDDCYAVRYEVQNWVAPEDFDHTRRADYRRLRFRSVPNLFLSMSSRTYADEIRHGNMNYFDIPFETKVVFRAAAACWVAAGTHRLKTSGAHEAPEVWGDAIRVAHLPFLSRTRLELRVGRGELAVRDGFSVDHGWQSQMLRDISREGRLDEFWTGHSLSQAGEPAGPTPPFVVADDGLATALEEALGVVDDAWGDDAGARGGGSPSELPGDDHSSRIDLETATRVARGLQVIADELSLERDALAAENERLRADVEKLRAESDPLLQEIDGLRGEIAGCHAMVAQVRESPSWRLTAPLRAAAGRVRRAMGRHGG